MLRIAARVLMLPVIGCKYTGSARRCEWWRERFCCGSARNNVSEFRGRRWLGRARAKQQSSKLNSRPLALIHLAQHHRRHNLSRRWDLLRDCGAGVRAGKDDVLLASTRTPPPINRRFLLFGLCLPTYCPCLALTNQGVHVARHNTGLLLQSRFKGPGQAIPRFEPIITV